MEAASSSDDSDDSSTTSSSSQEYDNILARPREKTLRSSSSSESDNASSDGDDESPSHDKDNGVSNGDGSSTDGSDRDEPRKASKHNNHLQLLPLAERIHQQEQQGVKQKIGRRRERKDQALRIVSERLAEMKQQKDDDSKQQYPSSNNKKKKKSKHAPTEVSSKRADFYRRKMMTTTLSGTGVDLGAHRYKPADPRVSNLHGHLDVGHYEHHYAFLQEVRQQEIATLRQRVAAYKMSGRKGQRKRRELGITQNAEASLERDTAELKRLLQEKAAVEREQVELAAKRAVKKNLQKEVAEGKRGIYFPKRKELKRMHLEAKFEEIRKRGGDRAVQKAVSKRRKKQKSRDAGKLGGRRTARGDSD